MERVRWYEGKAGSVSSIRIMAMIIVITGCITVLSAVVAMFMRIPESVAIGGVGAGMASIAEVFKSIQKKYEE